VRRDSLEHIVALTNVDHVLSGVFWIWTSENVHTSARHFLTKRKLFQHRARRNHELAGPIHDLGGQ
jgi:hypothetical protein